jgi:hypothetical protein
VIRSGDVNNITLQLEALFQRDTVIVTIRRAGSVAGCARLPLSVITASQVEDAGAFNVNQG